MPRYPVAHGDMQAEHRCGTPAHVSGPCMLTLKAPHLLAHFEVCQGQLACLCRGAGCSSGNPLVVASQTWPQRQLQLGDPLCRLRPGTVLCPDACQRSPQSVTLILCRTSMCPPTNGLARHKPAMIGCANLQQIRRRCVADMACVHAEGGPPGSTRQATNAPASSPSSALSTYASWMSVSATRPEACPARCTDTPEPVQAPPRLADCVLLQCL